MNCPSMDANRRGCEGLSNAETTEGHIVSVSIRVRGYHEDRFGHVNNARYLEFLEEGRWAYLEAHGPEGGFGALGVFPVVVHLSISYRRPAVSGDTLVVSTRLLESGSRKFVMYQDVSLFGSSKRLCSAEVSVVLVDALTGQPVALREEILDAWPDLASARRDTV
jgi:thioesterase III